MKDQILSEAKRLYDLGYAIHWLHKKSKRPIESNWTTGPRKSWDALCKTYEPGMNVGVRLGKPSKVHENYLAVIDVDVKSTDPKHKAEVEELLKKLTLNQNLPEVKSGRGNGSKHFHILTPKPLAPKTFAKSKDIVKVYMPGSIGTKPSKREVERLTQDEIDKGYRLRNAWEIGIMGDGQQVVLPPSVHPDSGKNYAWAHSFEPAAAAKFNLALLKHNENQDSLNVEKAVDNVEKSNVTKEVTFYVEPVDLFGVNIPDKIFNMITTGEGVEDRSASLLPISHALFRAGLTPNQILNVLSDPKYFISTCAYDHAQTKSQVRAAKWLWKYSVKKVFTEYDPKKIFEVPITEAVELSEMEQFEQQATFEELNDWRSDLDMTDKGLYKNSLRNVLTILRGAAGVDVVRRNTFSYRDFYSKATPWGGVENASLTDDDMVKIKFWISENYGFEPNVNTVDEAMRHIALDNAFDPVVDMLEALPEWDQVERLDTWLVNHFGATGDAEYLSQVLRKWFVAMIMRAYEPGAKFDWLPIFEGPQGVGKSSFGKIIVGEKYFLDALPDLNNKDAALSLQGIWCVELGELAQLRKNEIEPVKAFLSRTVDKVRPPYGQRWLEIPRRCVFFGTTNSSEYLKDDSGNRRFKPVKVGALDFEQLEKDRDQLLAEALYLYKGGFEYTKRLDLEGRAKLVEVALQAKKTIQDDSDLMAELLLDFIEKEAKIEPEKQFDFKRFKLLKLFVNDSPNFGPKTPFFDWKLTSWNQRMAAKALRKLGFSDYESMGTKWWKPSKEAKELNEKLKYLKK